MKRLHVHSQDQTYSPGYIARMWAHYSTMIEGPPIVHRIVHRVSKVFRNQSQPHSHTLRTLPLLCQSTAPGHNAQHLPMLGMVGVLRDFHIYCLVHTPRLPRHHLPQCTGSQKSLRAFLDVVPRMFHTWTSLVHHYLTFMGGSDAQQVAYSVTLLRESAHEWYIRYERRHRTPPSDWA